jgi:hypothetical protein
VAYRIIVNKIENEVVLLKKNYIAVLRRSRLIAQCTAIKLTYAIEGVGSRQPGGSWCPCFLCAACSLLLVGCDILTAPHFSKYHARMVHTYVLELLKKTKTVKYTILPMVIRDT